MTPALSPQDIPGLISDDRQAGLFRIDRRSFARPEVLDWERQQIFDRCWSRAAPTASSAR
jgi:hypothetical protein